MNKIYQLKFNTQTGTLVAISECQTVKAKSKRQKSSLKLVASLVSLALVGWAHSATAASSTPPFTDSVKLPESSYTLADKAMFDIQDKSVTIEHKGDLTLSSNVSAEGAKSFSLIKNQGSSLTFTNEGNVTVNASYASTPSNVNIGFVSSNDGQAVIIKAKSWSINHQRRPTTFYNSTVDWYGAVDATWDATPSVLNLAYSTVRIYDRLSTNLNTNTGDKSTVLG